jgi:hypothetical protein
MTRHLHEILKDLSDVGRIYHRLQVELQDLQYGCTHSYEDIQQTEDEEATYTFRICPLCNHSGNFKELKDVGPNDTGLSDTKSENTQVNNLPSQTDTDEFPEVTDE